MQNPTVHMLLDSHPIISDQIKRPALAVVLGELDRVLAAGTPGDVVEFGCYTGTTSLFLRRLLDARELNGGRQLHAYDSFEGLPPKSMQDASPAGEEFTAGELTASKRQLLENFRRAHLQPPIVHKGWFGGLSAADVPDQIAFAFLDGDFYGSILDSLRLVWPRMTPGGTITIDDYKREKLPGVERAVDVFLRDKQYQSLTYAHNIAVLRV